MTLAAGHSLSFYEILGSLGAGAMGEVYRARDTRLEREVAIKVLPEHFADNEERLRRFEREAKSLAALNHPNVAQIHGVDQCEDTWFLVLELVPGETLEDRIARGALPLEEAVEVCRQIAEGLEAAHEAGVIHRDLKPANVGITPDGRVKVLDFGLAKPSDPDAASGSSTDSVLATEEGRLLGTPTYMAPEQARGKPIDKRVDVWAFGCLLYECLTAARAFKGETISDVLAAVLQEEPEWSRLPSAMPPRVRALLSRSLVKDPRRRLRDMGEARLVLEEVLDPAREDHSAPNGVERSRASNQLTIGLALVTLVSAACAAWSWLRDAPPALREVLRFSSSINPESSDNFARRFALSPDGRTLVYRTISVSGTLGLRLRRLDQLESAWITGAVSGVVSPGGAGLAYVTTAGELCVGPIDGGPARTVLTGVSTFQGVAWSEDSHLYYSPAGGGAGVWRIPANGGEAAEVIGEDLQGGAGGYNWPSDADVLPGGRRILVNYRRRPGQLPDIVAVDLASGQVSHLTNGNYVRYVGGFLIFVDAGNTLMAAPFDSERLVLLDSPRSTGIRVETQGGSVADFAVSSSGDLVYTPANGKGSQLVWMDRDGTEAPVDPDLRADIESAALSPTGDRIAFGLAEDGKSAIWIYGVADETLSRLTFDGIEVSRPLWNPDGFRIAYVSDRGRSDGIRALWIQAADGSDEPQVLVESPRHAQELTWSSDGSAVAYRDGFDDGGKRRDIHVLRSAVDKTPRPIVATNADEFTPQLSPDGRFLAYTSDESGRNEVYVRPFPSGTGRWQISSEGGFGPLWRRDGRELFYIDKDSILIAVPVLEDSAFATGPHKKLFSTHGLTGDGYATPYDISPDGERFLMIKQLDAEMVMVVNWLEEVRRLFE